ncbi:MAG TPA: hypothetical protein VNJ01_17965 [Bacteriovoracaceae bacterium]|nr:hypothetical protein [Bacteriovoracaceae bacterium]
MKSISFLAVLLFSTASFARTKTFCGMLELQGSKVSIVRNSETILKLTSPEIIAQANRIIRLQDKTNYCVEAEVDFAVAFGKEVTYIPLEIKNVYQFQTACGTFEEENLTSALQADDRFIKQANTFIGLNDRGQRGMQKGLKYCFDFKLSAQGMQEKIIYGYEFRTYCGTLTDSRGNKFLMNVKRNVSLIVAVKGGLQKLVTQATALLGGNFDFGKSYCLDARLHERGWEAEIINAKEI